MSWSRRPRSPLAPLLARQVACQTIVAVTGKVSPFGAVAELSR